MAHNLLAGKKGIIFGALDSNSMAWKVAELVNAEGGEFVLTNTELALRMGAVKELAAKTGSELIASDATNIADLTNLFEQTKAKFGKIDFILHSIGMSPNIRKGKEYGDLNYDWYVKSLDISALSFHKIMQVAEKTDALNEWGSIVAISYIAAQRVFAGYGDMADAKATLESITRSYGYRLGKLKKVRVNTVSQSPTKTTAGSGIAGFNDFYNYAELLSPLGNADAESCAEYIVSLFSDYTRMVTMQNLFHDGGFSFTGISEDVIQLMNQAK